MKINISTGLLKCVQKNLGIQLALSLCQEMRNVIDINVRKEKIRFRESLLGYLLISIIKHVRLR